jgi:Uma2 family endonuclease
MATVASGITVAEFWKLCGDGRGRELVGGEVIELAPASAKHGKFVTSVVLRLAPFARDRQLGEVYSGDTGFLLQRDPDTVRGPDVAFVRRERLSAEPTEGFFPGAPDLAVEVVSPNDLAQDIERKVQDFLKAGTAMVWVLYPDTRHVMVYRSRGEARVLGEKETLDGADVLPGFACAVEELFRK